MEAKPCIHFICSQLLPLFGVTDVSAEALRLAKFNDIRATPSLARLLHHLILLKDSHRQYDVRVHGKHVDGTDVCGPRAWPLLSMAGDPTSAHCVNAISTLLQSLWVSLAPSAWTAPALGPSPPFCEGDNEREVDVIWFFHTALSNDGYHRHVSRYSLINGGPLWTPIPPLSSRELLLACGWVISTASIFDRYRASLIVKGDKDVIVSDTSLPPYPCGDQFLIHLAQRKATAMNASPRIPQPSSRDVDAALMQQCRLLHQLVGRLHMTMNYLIDETQSKEIVRNLLKAFLPPSSQPISRRASDDIYRRWVCSDSDSYEHHTLLLTQSTAITALLTNVHDLESVFWQWLLATLNLATAAAPASASDEPLACWLSDERQYKSKLREVYEMDASLAAELSLCDSTLQKMKGRWSTVCTNLGVLSNTVDDAAILALDTSDNGAGQQLRLFVCEQLPDVCSVILSVLGDITHDAPRANGADDRWSCGDSMCDYDKVKNLSTVTSSNAVSHPLSTSDDAQSLHQELSTTITSLLQDTQSELSSLLQRYLTRVNDGRDSRRLVVFGFNEYEA